MSIYTTEDGKAAPQSKLLTMSEVAQILGVSKRHLDHLREQRQIPFVKLGRLIRFHPAALEKAISDLTVAASQR